MRLNQKRRNALAVRRVRNLRRWEKGRERADLDVTRSDLLGHDDIFAGAPCQTNKKELYHTLPRSALIQLWPVSLEESILIEATFGKIFLFSSHCAS